MTPLKIALFGTSADPPTQAHQAILAGLAQTYDHVAVWASDNPFKQHGASLAQRTAMLELAAQTVEQSLGRGQPASLNIMGNTMGNVMGNVMGNAMGKSPRPLAVHPELSNPRSLITLQRAQQQWPHANFTLVIGSDLVSQVSQWYAAETLFAQVDVLVVPRPGYQLEASAVNWLRDRTCVTIAPFQGPNLSSTDYRQRHQRQQRNPVVSPAVQAYIQRENLYPCPDALLETTR